MKILILFCVLFLVGCADTYKCRCLTADMPSTNEYKVPDLTLPKNLELKKPESD